MIALVLWTTGLLASGLLLAWWRRRRGTVVIRMSDAWRRDHADDPLPEQLQ